MKIPLESLYLEHEPRVRWLLRARGIPESAIDDLVHDTFVVAYRRWNSRSEEVSPGQWLTGVARNVAFSYRRSEARRRRRARDVPEQAAPAMPDDVVAEREALEALRSFTATLSPKLREAFLLTDLAGVGVRQAAHTLGIPAATVQSRRRLARLRFQRYFTEREIDPVALRAAAMRAATPREQERRRQLAAIASTLGAPWGLALPAKLSTLAWAGLVAAGLSAGAIAAARSPPSAHVARSAVSPELPVVTAPERPTVLETTAPPEPQPPSLIRPPQSARRKVRSRKTSPQDPLQHDLRLLERAKAELEAGRARSALQRLRQTPLAAPTLQVERQRLLLDATCAAGSAEGATAVAQSLLQLGTTIDPADPCSDRKNH